jgi:hypothetical protein
MEKIEEELERNLETRGLDKDLEIQSIHSSSTDIETEDKETIRHDRRGKGGVLNEKDDIEAFPTVVNGMQDENGKEKGEAMTRTSTKSSWKDPGPPPDGGREAWIQGGYFHFFMSLEVWRIKH